MSDNTDYKKRIADVLLADKLDAMGAVLIEGPKACGKTTTAEQQANSILYMDDPDNMRQNLQSAASPPPSHDAPNDPLGIGGIIWRC